MNPITFDLTTLSAICILIAVIGSAVVYLGKLVKAIKKPQETNEARFKHIYERLDCDKEHLEKLDKVADENTKTLRVMLKANLAMLDHMKTGNNTGGMKEISDEIQEHLITGI